MIGKRLFDSENFGELKKRLLFSVFSISLLTVLLYFSLHPSFKLPIAAAFSFLITLGLFEFFSFAEAKKMHPPKYLLSSLSFCYLFLQSMAFSHPFARALLETALPLGIFLLFLNQFKQSDSPIYSLSGSFLGFFAISYLLSFLLKILYFPAAFSLQWLIYLILVCKMTDSTAYFAGKLFGKNKLAPYLSPGKTWEGAFAGLLGALLSSMSFSLLAFIPSLSLSESIFLGLSLSFFAQAGDLAESLLKRDAKVKDSNCLPGLGGILDTLDSLIFAAPFLYYVILFKHGAL